MSLKSKLIFLAMSVAISILAFSSRSVSGALPNSSALPVLANSTNLAMNSSCSGVGGILCMISFALAVAQSCHTVVAGVEHQVLECVRLVHEKMVYAHGLEIHRVVLAVVNAEFDVGKFRLQVHLPLDQSLFHGTGNGVSLLTQHFQVLLHAVQLILQDALLYLVRLGYHTELVVRKDDAVPVVVLDVVEDTPARWLSGQESSACLPIPTASSRRLPRT